MTLESFRAETKNFYLNHCKIVISYLAKFKWATISIRTEEPYLSSMPTTPYDWEESTCGNAKELCPYDAPAPLEKHVLTISYHDANLFHNVTTRR